MSKISVTFKRKTVPMPTAPSRGKWNITGMNTSRTKNRNVLTRYPAIYQYLTSHLSPSALEIRKTVVDNICIVPSLNNNLQRTLVKYIFTIPKAGSLLTSPWENIPNTQWYVVEAAKFWPCCVSAEDLVDKCVSFGNIRDAPELDECAKILYFQYHVYTYHPSIGRNYRYCE